MTHLYRIYIGMFPCGTVFTDETGHYRWIDFTLMDYSDAKFEDAAHAKRDLVGYIEDKYNFKVR